MGKPANLTLALAFVCDALLYLPLCAQTETPSIQILNILALKSKKARSFFHRFWTSNPALPAVRSYLGPSRLDGDPALEPNIVSVFKLIHN